MMKRVLLATLLALASVTAAAQQTLLQGGPFTAGHVPMYLQGGSTQPVVGDSGTAAGGTAGVNLKELGLTARGSGTPPYANAGSGYYGTNFCDYDAPTSTGNYHYLCMSPNAQGGGLLAYGAAGTAPQLPLQIAVNGAFYQFTGGNLGPVYESLNVTGTEVANPVLTPFLQINGTLSGNATSGVFMNTINVADNLNTTSGGSPLNASTLAYFSDVMGASATGGRNGVNSSIFLPVRVADAPNNNFYNSLVGHVTISANQGGTSSASPSGNFIGVLGEAFLQSGATYLTSVAAGAFGLTLPAGSSYDYADVVQIDVNDTGATSYYTLNGLTFRAGAGTGGFKMGIAFGNANSTGFPILDSGTVIGVQDNPSHPDKTVAHGVDFTQLTCTSDCFASPGFAVDGSGNIDANNITALGETIGAGIGGPVLAINGGSSGAGNGSAIFFKNAGTTHSAVGNYSVIDGGAFSEDLMLFTGDALGKIVMRAGTTDNFDFTGKTHIEAIGTAPSAVAGSGATVVGNDTAGRVTVGSGPSTTVVLSFANAWSHAPICFGQDETTALTVRVSTVTTSAVTFTASGTLSASDKVSYHCIGYN